MSLQGAGRSFAGGSTAARVIVVVPDGVAKVSLYLPAETISAGGPTYRHAATVTAPAHSNVAAFQIDRECCQGPPLMIWYAPDGHIVKRIGRFAAANHRTVPPPKPAPETPLSRRAERDPSTPNPVWVIPSTGGLDTSFALHFRVLLNDADYSYRFSGPRCPQITFPVVAVVVPMTSAVASGTAASRPSWARPGARAPTT